MISIISILITQCKNLLQIISTIEKKDRGWSKWVVFEKDHDLQKIVSIIYLMKQLLSFDSEKVCFCTFENLIHRNLSNLNLE